MSDDSKQDDVSTDLTFHWTKPHACSYLPEQEAQTIFLDPAIEPSISLYEKLTQLNFRRSGDHFYRPHCNHCQACVASRVLVDHFSLSKRFRRVLNTNKDLTLMVSNAVFRDEDYRLFDRYIEHRHKEGDMYPTSEKTYQDFLTRSEDYCIHMRYFQDDTLVALAVTDILLTGLSSIYTFFDPLQAGRSLGVFSILMQINLAKKLHLPYVYLGYWVANCKKMNYKTDYQPLELLINDQWRPFNPKKQ